MLLQFRRPKPARDSRLRSRVREAFGRLEFARCPSIGAQFCSFFDLDAASEVRGSGPLATLNKSFPIQAGIILP